jgi:hypothetical protein
VTPLIFYHRDQDGACAAWCVLQRYPDAECVSVQYGDPVPLELAGGRAVWVVDFSWPSDELRALGEVADGLTVIDHHRTSEVWLYGWISGISPGRGVLTGSRAFDLWALEGEYRAVWDPDRSGCGLTWDTLFPGQPRPWFVDYVEDRDLWRWALPDSRAVNAYLGTLESGPRRFDKLDVSFDGHLIEAGEAVLRYQARLVDAICEHAREERLPLPPHARPGDWARLRRPRVPTVHSHVLCSEVGNQLASEPGVPFAVVVEDCADGSVYHLRSVPCEACVTEPVNEPCRAERCICVDVSQIAEAYGGGGHRHAAGFEVKP